MKQKQFTVKIKGEDIPVTEEVYRAYKRPVWTERKRRIVRSQNEWSFEKVFSDGYDIASDENFEDQIINKLLMDELLSYLSDDERQLIEDLYLNGFSHREIAKRHGVYHRSIIYRKNQIIEKLKDKVNN